MLKTILMICAYYMRYMGDANSILSVDFPTQVLVKNSENLEIEQTMKKDAMVTVEPSTQMLAETLSKTERAPSTNVR